VATEKDVFSDGDRWNRSQFLVDHADSVRHGPGRRSKLDRFSIEHDFAFVGRMDTAQYFHEGALARAIFSKEPVDFAFPQREIDIGKGDRAAKAFDDAGERQNVPNGIGRRGGVWIRAVGCSRKRGSGRRDGRFIDW